MLKALEIRTVFDLACSEALHALAGRGEIEGGDEPDAARGRWQAVRKQVEGIAKKLELANDPSRHLARLHRSAAGLLQSAFAPPPPTSDDESPPELLPEIGDGPSEKVFFSTLVFDELVNAQTDELKGPIAADKLARSEGIQRRLGRGAMVTFCQSWTFDGLALGQLLHSVSLAPGESALVAVQDWSRRVRAQQSDNVVETEELSNYIEHGRAVSEIQSAVASEMQAGESGQSVHSSASQEGGGAGPGLFGALFGGSSESWGKSKSSTVASGWSSSYGRRDMLAQMAQHVADRTMQAASAVRERRALVVKEVAQSERDEVSTRAIANYNHMHALTVQYYEAVQVYRVAVRPEPDVTPCLFIPLELLNFYDDRARDRFRFALAAAALRPEVRDALLSSGPTVGLTFRSEGDPPLRPDPPAQVPESTAGGTPGKPPGAPPSPAPPPARTLPLRAHGPGSLLAGLESIGLNRREIESLAILAGGPILFPGASDYLRLPPDCDVYVWPETSAKIELTRSALGSEKTKTVDNVSRAGHRLQDLTRLTARWLPERSEEGESARALQWLIERGATSVRFRTLLDPGTRTTIVEFKVRADAHSTIGHLNRHRLHYSQAAYRSLDGASWALILQRLEYAGKTVADIADPLPVAIAGNFAVFRYRVGEPAKAGDADVERDPWEAERIRWLRWREERGLDGLHAGSRPPVTQSAECYVPVPSGGVFAEAVLGASVSAERLDITRFWNWQDSPIPVLPPAIQPPSLQSRQDAGTARPGSFAPPLVRIEGAPASPAPVGLQSVMSALSNGSMFRDMGSLASTIALAQLAAQGSQQGAASAATQAIENWRSSTEAGLKILGAILGAVAGPGAGAASAVGASLNKSQDADTKGAGKNEKDALSSVIGVSKDVLPFLLA